MVTAAHGGCSVTGETNSDTNGAALHESNQCAETIVPEQEGLIRTADPDVVVWWDRWVLYDFLTADGEHVQTGTARFWALRKAGLETAVQRLTAGGATVALVGIEPPGTQICGGRPVESCAERLRFRVERYHDITTRWNEIMQQYAERHPDLAEYVDITHGVCHDAASPCDDQIDGVPARPDGTHYGGPGGAFVSNLLAGEIAPWMTPGGAAPPSTSAGSSRLAVPTGSSPLPGASPSPGRPVVMFVGDSVPEQLDPTLHAVMKHRGWGEVSAATGGCSVTAETTADTNGEPLHLSNQCATVVVPNQDDLIRLNDPDVIVWWDRWVIYDFLTADGEHVRTDTPRFWKLRRAGLRSAVRRLTVDGAKVAFVGIEPPGMAMCGGRPLSSCPVRLRFRAVAYPTVSKPWNSIMHRYAKRHPNLAVYIDIRHAVCHDRAVPCDDRIHGVPARPDGTHYEGRVAGSSRSCWRTTSLP